MKIQSCDEGLVYFVYEDMLLFTSAKTNCLVFFSAHFWIGLFKPRACTSDKNCEESPWIWADGSPGPVAEMQLNGQLKETNDIVSVAPCRNGKVRIASDDTKSDLMNKHRYICMRGNNQTKRYFFSKYCTIF